MQTEPCVFNIMPAGKQKREARKKFSTSLTLTSDRSLHYFSFAIIRTRLKTGKPDPLSNCSILNQTFDVFQVVCSEGFDGGLPQEFIAEIYLMGHIHNEKPIGYVNSK